MENILWLQKRGNEETFFMNNLPKNLKDEYEYLIEHNADIEGIEHTEHVVLRIIYERRRMII